jgi:hypothetical protein
MKWMKIMQFAGRNTLLASFTVLLMAGAANVSAEGHAEAATEVEACKPST